MASTMTTTNSSAILLPEQVGDLLIQPTLAGSVAAQVSTVIPTSSKEFRVPVVARDPSAAWVAEGEEIPVSDAALGEASATMAKLAGLSIISNELRDDSSPEATAAVGAGLARDLSRKLDQAFFGALAAPAPAGLASLDRVGRVPVAETTLGNTDAFVGAMAGAESQGTFITRFVCSPNTMLNLAMVKKAEGSNEPLLQNDPTKPAQRLVAGVPILTSTAVDDQTIWGLPSDRVYLVVREDAEVEVDGSVFFTSDRSAIRAKMRVGFCFPHEAAIIKIELGGDPEAALRAATVEEDPTA